MDIWVVNFNMNVRYISNPKTEFYSNTFNLSSLSKIIFCNSDNGCDSDFIDKFEVFIKGKWVLLTDAFDNNNLITDNHNVYFFEPTNETDKKRGYCL